MEAVEDDDEIIVASIGERGADLVEASSTARRAYGGFIASCCGRVCAVVDRDGRCADCGPLPVEHVALSDEETLQRESAWADRIRQPAS